MLVGNFLALFKVILLFESGSNSWESLCTLYLMVKISLCRHLAETNVSWNESGSGYIRIFFMIS